MDFLEGFPRVGGKSVILTIVNRFSKLVHFVALSHPYSAQSVAQAFSDNIVRLHGFPCSIVSDRNSVLPASFGRNYSSLLASSSCAVLPSTHRRMARGH